MKKNMKGLQGQKFGRLLVVQVDEDRSVKDKKYWLCQCDCGNSHVTRRDNLTSGRTTSCGCVHREAHTTHGMRNTIIYRKWIGMRQRCNDSNYHGYKNYGGRGIKICERWDKFENFLEDMGLPPSNSHQPDRIDNDGDYEPGNVRWATPKENSNNRRDSVIIEHKGKRKTMRQWADSAGIKYSTFQYRLSAGWSMERILSQKVDEGKAKGGHYERDPLR